MSELKFRIWDKTNKRMIQNDEILSIDFRFREIEYCLMEKFFSITFEESEIQQCTGLKDKNGVDIYAGDLLEGLYHFPGDGWYDTGEGDYFIREGVRFEDGAYKCGAFLVSEIANSVKVIGNIYENRG